MQAFDLDSQNPQGPLDSPPADHWSVPVGRIAGIRLYVSYSVFFTLAILAVLITTVQYRQGEADLPVIATAAIAFWMTGWLVQLLVFFFCQLSSIARSDVLTIGILGVEVGYPLSRPICWSAMTNVLVSATCFAGLLIFGVGCLAVHMYGQGLPLSSYSVWMETLRTPGFGLGSIKNIYLTATWLFWCQAVCQTYPMPRCLGRGAMVSALVLFAAESGEDFKLKLVRRTIQLVSIITIMIALSVMLVEPKENVARWPVLVVLSLLLWQSSGRRDLLAWIRSVEVARFDQSDSPVLSLEDFHTNQKPQPGIVGKTLESVRMHRKRKRAIAVLQKEREEAVDAARLDEILEIVSQHGTDALSPEDRAVLERVSVMLRKSRQPDSPDGGSEN
ncbi:hypothetical protein LOC67_10910 [Stieleria sp. JC731]|uniref:hypothetical protein n=1 Tax=Pirellulaceae TaxID=2691357 RepID=UPI001E63A790|nr:hypothetical protein [Stieleria sp. JC731]MCC9601056.1 hypothetical protein [Stieleria sp. JC731]